MIDYMSKTDACIGLNHCLKLYIPKTYTVAMETDTHSNLNINHVQQVYVCSRSAFAYICRCHLQYTPVANNTVHRHDVPHLTLRRSASSSESSSKPPKWNSSSCTSSLFPPVTEDGGPPSSVPSSPLPSPPEESVGNGRAFKTVQRNPA